MKKLSFIWVMVLFVTVLLQQAWAEPLRIGIGISKPPYVIQENNSGVEYEIVERALLKAGYEMEPRYMPLLRIPHNLNGGVLDGGMHLRANMSIDGFFSAEVITYENYAISLANAGLELGRFQDLKGLSVLAFQNAHKFLGKRYADAIKGAGNYAEIANQELQVKMLLAGRAEVVIADHRIFLHFLNQLDKGLSKDTRFTFHRLFKPTPYRAAFRSREIRDKFDSALIDMKKSGEYDQIIEKYMSESDQEGLYSIYGQ